MNFETVDAGNVALLGLLGDEGRVDLEEDVVERRAEVGTVDGCVSRGLRVVEIFAFRAVEFDCLLTGVVGLAHWQEWLRVAEDTGTFAEVGFLVLV